MMARVEVRQVRRWYPVHRLNGMLRDQLNALMLRRWDALVILCLFAHNWLAGSGEGPAGGAAVLAIRLTEYLDLGRVLDLQALSIPKGVTIPRSIFAHNHRTS